MESKTAAAATSADANTKVIMKDLKGGPTTFDMSSLALHLPKKRKGIPRSRGYACLLDALSDEDLQIGEDLEVKRRKYKRGREEDMAPLLAKGSWLEPFEY